MWADPKSILQIECVRLNAHSPEEAVKKQREAKAIPHALDIFVEMGINDIIQTEVPMGFVSTGFLYPYPGEQGSCFHDWIRGWLDLVDELPFEMTNLVRIGIQAILLYNPRSQ